MLLVNTGQITSRRVSSMALKSHRVRTVSSYDCSTSYASLNHKLRTVATSCAALTSNLGAQEKEELPKVVQQGGGLPKNLILPTPIIPPQLKDAAPFLNGALLIDKPLGWTSFDVCGKLRGALKFLGKLKVGHAGTLDPLATGLLIICTGKGTKACDTFMAMAKTYSGTIRLGEGTATYDAEVEVTERMPWDHISDDDIKNVISTKFLGDLIQIPPMYSALKVKGQKLCNLAREGVVIERQPRPISISRFEVHRDPASPQDLHFVVDCSKGTYIRSLAYDLGRDLGTVAHLTGLRREAIGEYSVKTAWLLPDLLEQLLVQKERTQVLKESQ